MKLFNKKLIVLAHCVVFSLHMIAKVFLTEICKE
jgi:hypothetical protein